MVGQDFLQHLIILLRSLVNLVLSQLLPVVVADTEVASGHVHVVAVEGGQLVDLAVAALHHVHVLAVAAGDVVAVLFQGLGQVKGLTLSDELLRHVIGHVGDDGGIVSAGEPQLQLLVHLHVAVLEVDLDVHVVQQPFIHDRFAALLVGLQLLLVSHAGIYIQHQGLLRHYPAPLIGLSLQVGR